ncbi:MAG: DUF1003 domain-containing protein [Bacillota bacterium]|nr:DUF1003 domain-containing protein [Bacillota bacterium]
MPQKQKLTQLELINLILDDVDQKDEDEELVHMLLDKTVSKNINHSQKANLSIGAKVADKVAEVAGSWGFIITFCSILVFWIILNGFFLLKPFDKYPFILLNLVLSCVAAIQAPVIMMSQNRQEQKDRLRAENDYKVNLKSEIIIEDLHSKLDKIISTQEQIVSQLNSINKTNLKEN